MSTVGVVGAGYVGLTTAACMARLGHDVVCGDIDEEKVERLSNGEITFFEHGLEDLVREGLEAGRLRFVHGAAEATTSRDIVFLCLPTPQSEDGSADLSLLIDAATTIGPHVTYEGIVVTKSTVPVGSSHAVKRALARADVRVVSNPEFLREGSAVDDFLSPDRIVVGSDDRDAAVEVAQLYEQLNTRVLVTDAASAELTKYASNAFLATKLSYVNSIATICERVGADVEDVLLGMGYDHRIGTSFAKPGPGWGGSCFPKDTAALLNLADSLGFHFDLLCGAIAANSAHMDRVARMVADAAGGTLNGRLVAVWGLTFKAMTDDLRDSPALAVIARLLHDGAVVQAYDPMVPAFRAPIDEQIVLTESALAAAANADVLVVLTEWDEFRWVSPPEVAGVMVGRGVVDARNVLHRAQWTDAGFAHHGIGRA